jgi:membrane protease YdiL (CAAX protease family)
MKFIHAHKYALFVITYTAVVFSKIAWLPLLNGAAFWIADIVSFVFFPLILAKRLNLFALPAYVLPGKFKQKLSILELIFFILITYLCLLIAIKIGLFLGLKIAKINPNFFPPLYSYASKIPAQSILKFVVLIYFAVTAAIIEETVYRGYLSHAIAEYVPQKWQIVSFIATSTLIFGMIHLGTGIANTVSAIFAGFVLAIAYVKTKDIRVPIAAHFLDWLLQI